MPLTEPGVASDEAHPQESTYISLVLPAFNEEENIEEAVVQAIPPLEAISPSWEIVIVNDASTDATADVAESLALRYPGRVRVLHLRRNGGLGTAMRTGFEHARGEILVYCDSDLPFDMDAIREAHDVLLADEADLVAGYRDGRERDGLRRMLYTRVYNALFRVVLGIRVRDVNCPLKLFRRDILATTSLQSAGVFIDGELLALTRRGGFEIAQLPVRYTSRVRGTSTLARPSVIVETLREMVLFRTGRLRGKPAPVAVRA
jgi:glycosyltransferase involved in cell wall biosynthesis